MSRVAGSRSAGEFHFSRLLIRTCVSVYHREQHGSIVSRSARGSLRFFLLSARLETPGRANPFNVCYRAYASVRVTEIKPAAGLRSPRKHGLHARFVHAALGKKGRARIERAGQKPRRRNCIFYVTTWLISNADLIRSRARCPRFRPVEREKYALRALQTYTRTSSERERE